MPTRSSARPGAIPGLLTIGTIVFCSGAIVMALELTGSRLLAPYFGNSLFVWTSLIGVMLGFMSLGYFLGGRLADRHVDPGWLFWILIGSAISVALVGFSESWLLPALAQGDSLRLLAVLSAAILFAVPSTLLGMVSPYCIRLRMYSVEDSGATVGSLYALSTLGSIAGTFAAGFWLIAMFGTHSMLMLLAGSLAALSLLLLRPGLSWRRVAGVGVVVCVIVAVGVIGGAKTIDTQYDRYFLRELSEPGTGRPMVALARSTIEGAESVSYRDTGEAYRFAYYDYYDLVSTLRGPVTNVLMVGGGTFSYPRLFVASNPDARMDVVEIDPALYDIAKSDFGYVDDSRQRLYFEDGRTFLNRAQGPYEAVLMDAFKSEATVPYQLTTRETWEHAYRLLDDDGVLVINVIASPQDERARFFDALYKTVSDVFPETAAFAVQDPVPGAVNNTAIVAMKNPDADISTVLQQKAPEFYARMYRGYTPPADTRALTDDYAPVDQYLLGL